MSLFSKGADGPARTARRPGYPPVKGLCQPDLGDLLFFPWRQRDGGKASLRAHPRHAEDQPASDRGETAPPSAPARARSVNTHARVPHRTETCAPAAQQPHMQRRPHARALGRRRPGRAGCAAAVHHQAGARPPAARRSPPRSPASQACASKLHKQAHNRAQRTAHAGARAAHADSRAIPTRTRAQHARIARQRSAAHRAHLPTSAAASLPQSSSHTRARTHTPHAGARIGRRREEPEEPESRLEAVRDPDLDPSRPQADSLVLLVPLGDAQCVRRRGECACARVCEMRIVAGWLLLMWASVLCVRRCAGVRCARAVRVCVLESRVSLRVLRARRRVLCAVLCCAPVCAALRRRLGWQGCAVGCGALRVVARLPDGVRRPRSPPDRVVGGPGREHAVGAACEAAARLARKFPCDEGRAHVCSRCGRGRARRAARSHRGPTPAGLLRDEGGLAKRPCRHRVAAKEKKVDLLSLVGIGLSLVGSPGVARYAPGRQRLSKTATLSTY